MDLVFCEYQIQLDRPALETRAFGFRSAKIFFPNLRILNYPPYSIVAICLEQVSQVKRYKNLAII